MTTANVVFSGPTTDAMPIKREAKVASGQTILPGALVTLSSDEFINHATAGQGGDIMVAEMNLIEQKSVTEALTVGQTSEAFVPVPGQTFNLILAASQTITKGEALASNGDGSVKSSATDGTETVLFIAEEAITTTGATARIRARAASSGFSA